MTSFKREDASATKTASGGSTSPKRLVQRSGKVSSNDVSDIINNHGVAVVSENMEDCEQGDLITMETERIVANKNYKESA